MRRLKDLSQMPVADYALVVAALLAFVMVIAAPSIGARASCCARVQSEPYRGPRA